jgi:hypothetical protein
MDALLGFLRRLEEAGRAEGADADYVARRFLRDALDAHGQEFTPRGHERRADEREVGGWGG